MGGKRQEKCVVAELHLAINPSSPPCGAARSLLFLRSTRHLIRAAPSFPHRMIAYRRARRQEIGMKRREFLKLSLGGAAGAALSREARAQAGVKEIRVGYQKNGVLV